MPTSINTFDTYLYRKIPCIVTDSLKSDRPAGWVQVTPKDTAIKPFCTRVSWIVDTPTWIQREKEGKNLPQPSKEKASGKKDQSRRGDVTA